MNNENKINHMERAEVVKAMETIARCINDERIFESWIISGVADGDINEKTTLQDIIECCYTEQGNFQDLMDLFIRLMYRASGNGGLYCDGIVSQTREIKWS